MTGLPFLDRTVSEISIHGTGCCAAAQRWLVAVGLGHGLSAAWVGERIEWAPTEWPTYWCDLLAEPRGDCGVQAAVAEHVLRMLGAPVRRVQMILRYSAEELAQWQGIWKRASNATDWIETGHCYHEAVAVGDDRVRILDATEPVKWTAQADGLAALRLDGPSGRVVAWEDTSLIVGRWHVLPAASAEG